jgi:uncharacterized protein (TIGR02391 family)
MQDEVQRILEQIQNLKTDLTQLGGVEPEEKTLIVPKPMLEQLVTDNELFKAVSKLFNDGHHAQAVAKACIFLDNLVKNKSGISATGDALMRTAFSAKKPVLKINSFSNSSEEDEQHGYMDIYAGIMMGIRNPRAHEHDWEDSEFRAIQLLTFINHLVERVKLSSKA